MRKDVFRKGMILAIIGLFIGAGFVPSISGNQKFINGVKRETNSLLENNEPPVDYWEIVDTVGFWHFDEGSGDTAYDNSSYGNIGYCAGTEWVSGHDGYGLYFNSSRNGAVTIDDDPSLDFNDLGENEGFMIDFWMKVSELPEGHSGLVAKMYKGGYNVILENDGRVLFQIRNQDVYHYVRSNTKMDKNWHHIVALWSGDTMYLYIDDMSNPDNSTYVGDFTLAEAGNNKWLDIGNDWPTDWDNPFDGMIDEVRISRIIPVGGNRPPIAKFEWSPKNPEKNQEVTFNALNSIDPDGTITSYEWDFDDDGIYDATGITAVFLWPLGGIYSVTLKVVDDCGSIGIITEEIYVENHPPSVNISYPKSESVWLTGEIVINGAAFDHDGNETIEGIYIQIDEGEPERTNGNATYWWYEWNPKTEGFNDGRHSIIAIAIDDEGLHNIIDENSSVLIYIDNNPPNINITYPNYPVIYIWGMGFTIFNFFAIIGPFPFKVDADDGYGSGVKQVTFDLICARTEESLIEVIIKDSKWIWNCRNRFFRNCILKTTAFDNIELTSSDETAEFFKFF